MEFDGALRPAKDGVALDVEVVPGASESLFPAGYNPWRKRIEAKVRAPPEKGEANAALCALVADFFDVPPRFASVTSGATSRRKTVTIEGLRPEAAARRLAAHGLPED